MEAAPTSIEVLLRPTLVQSDEPSDLRGSLSHTTRYRCTHGLVYTTPDVCQAVTNPICRRQILTIKVDPGAVSVKIFIMSVDP